MHRELKLSLRFRKTCCKCKVNYDMKDMKSTFTLFPISIFKWELQISYLFF